MSKLFILIIAQAIRYAILAAAVMLTARVALIEIGFWAAALIAFVVDFIVSFLAEFRHAAVKRGTSSWL